MSLFCTAQNYNIAMQVSKSDLELNTYAKDSTANALIIYDHGNSYVDRESFDLRFKIQQKIKILKTEGKDLGEIEVILYKGDASVEKIKNIRGATHNLENGEIVRTKLSSEAIFTEENENYNLVKFVLPNVKVGSVITYSYETRSRFMTKYQPWYFQGPNPVLYSEYNTSIPANYDYHIKLVGNIPLKTNEAKIERGCLEVGNGGNADCTVSKYVMVDIPAYNEEGYTTTPLNYTSRIEYELNEIKRFDGTTNKISKSWDGVDKELRTDSDFGRQISKKSLVKNLLPKTITEIKNDFEKANAIYQYVLDNYKWNKKIERYDVSIKKLLKENIGSVFEINLLLENLLTSEGFKVLPILMSTRNNGLITKIYPVLTDFNYVILKITIDGKDHYLDATNPYLSFGELPYRCLNQYGRLMDFKAGSSWEDISAAKYSFRQHRVELNSFKNELITGILTSNFTGYHAHNLKRRFDENPIDYKKRKTDDYTVFEIDKHDIIDYDKKKFGFQEKIEFTFEPEFIGNKIYLNPFFIKFFDENPFKLQERTYPIDFGYKDSYSYAMSIDLGDDLKILEIPESISMALPNGSGSLIFNTETTDNKLIMYFKIKFSKTIYEANFYQYLKEFMNTVVDTQKNTVIVLEKQ
jgi:hypothetical protein